MEIERIRMQITLSNLELNFQNALTFAKKQDKFYPARLAAMVMSLEKVKMY